MKREFLLAFAAALAPFVILATLNCGGYRFGASDQAFYVPAILARLNPELYPHDRPLIASQARLTFVDETVAALVRSTGITMPVLFAMLYLVSLVALAAAAASIASSLYRSRWTAVALLGALTLRHAIARSGTNTLEGYFHPRQIAFGLGGIAVAGFLRGWSWPTALLIGAASLVHPTTALWFAAWLTVAIFVAEPRLRVGISAVAACGLALSAFAVTRGPLAGRLAVMDREWVETLATKDYLFPLSDWSVSTWLVNLSYIPVIVWVLRRRRSAGLLVPREAPLAAGCLALVVIFAALLPFNAAHVQLAVQLQPARIFWMLDFLAVVYAVWALAEGVRPTLRARTVALVVIALSAIRGAYVKLVVVPTRPVVQMTVAGTDWARVMEWARRTPVDRAWLAHPVHAALYGTSVRVAGERDVFVEAIKDAAIGMYDRDVALRTRDRLHALGEFDSLTPAHARQLGAEYDLTYLVTERSLDLPVAYTSGLLRVYQLR